MPNAKAFGLIFGLWLTACAGPAERAEEGPPTASQAEAAGQAPAWLFQREVPGIRAMSCAGGPTAASEIIAVKTAPVSLGGAVHTADGAAALRYVAGLHLTSADPRLGGLSGLDITPGGLMAVSDGGHVFSFELMDGSALEVRAGAETWPLRGSDGSVLSGKSQGDAEGLSLRDGIAFVSFERDHRVLGFDFGTCKGAARGVEVADISARAPGLTHRLPGNNGTEAITLMADGRLKLGIEQIMDGSPLGQVMADGSARFPERLVGADGIAITGLASLEGRLFSVHRSYAPGVGNRIVLMMYDTVPDAPAVPTRLATLARPLTVDNFEGIAVRRIDPQTVRLFIISDNNFSARQRTLLMAFDFDLAVRP